MSCSVSACACVTFDCASSKGPLRFLHSVQNLLACDHRFAKSIQCSLHLLPHRLSLAQQRLLLLTGSTATLVNANQTGHAMLWLSCRGDAGGGLRLRTMSQCSGEKTSRNRNRGTQSGWWAAGPVNLSTCQPVNLSTCQPVNLSKLRAGPPTLENSELPVDQWLLPWSPAPAKRCRFRRQKHTFQLGSPPHNCMWTAIAIRCCRCHQVLEKLDARRTNLSTRFMDHQAYSSAKAFAPSPLLQHLQQ